MCVKQIKSYLVQIGVLIRMYQYIITCPSYFTQLKCVTIYVYLAKFKKLYSGKKNGIFKGQVNEILANFLSY